VETNKIVHVFETKKDKIRSLKHLLSKGNRIYLMAEEEKEAGHVASIIQVQQQENV